MTEKEMIWETMKGSDSNLVYFAAERTLMAWITSALGLMALGFVIDRFGLVLGQILPGVSTSTQPSSFSFWAGAALVSTGALMAVVGAVRYLSFAIHYHREGDADAGYGLVPAIFFTVLVAVAGVFIVAFLLEELG
jgi:putative membrane protein